MAKPTIKADARVVDASKRRLGVVAAEVATILMGKHEPTYSKHNPVEHHVRVTNAGKLDIPAKKDLQKTYTSFSGYPGGLKIKSLSQVRAQKGNGFVLREAVYGMLPRNRQRKNMMKRLFVEE